MKKIAYYEAPHIEIYVAMVEKGFSASSNENEGGGIVAPGWG